MDAVFDDNVPVVWRVEVHLENSGELMWIHAVNGHDYQPNGNAQQTCGERNSNNVDYNNKQTM